MGIFADKCQAIIDPHTKKALTGDALLEAQQDKKALRCGNKVKKLAKFCNKCGSPAPGGWWKCPSCNKWVGNESHFCWNCNTPLHPDQRAGIAGGRWQNRAGVFAEVLEVGDIKKLLKDGLIVSEGTVALLLDSGAYKDWLKPGSHNLDSLARKINHWGSPPPRTVVLVESGEVIVPMRAEGLRSAEDLELRFYGEVVLKFNPDKAQGFLSNLLKSQRELALEEITEALEREVRHAVESFCTTSTVEDIVKDPERRLHLENSLRETLERTTESWGIEVVRVSAAEFSGRAYEELRQKSGEVEEKRRELEFNERLRELLQSEQMGELKTEHDLEEYVAQLAQERGISDTHREHELGRLKQVQRHEVAAAELAHQMEQDAAKTRHDMGLQKEQDSYEREKLVDDTKSQAEAAEIALELRRKKDAAKLETMKEKGKILDGMSVETRIAMEEDPDRREQLIQLQKMSAAKGMKPEEVLAMSAADSPEAARALEAYFKVQSSESEKREELSKEHAAQLERMLNKTLESMAEATKRPGDVNIHK